MSAAGGESSPASSSTAVAAAAAAAKEVSRVRVFGGEQVRFSHESKETGTEMTFTVYLPPAAEGSEDTPAAVPVLWHLSGLTCTDENFALKAGAQRVAAECGVALVLPDTSPRGAGIDGEDDGWDFGTGAGFYLDATAEPWNKNYRMFSYVTSELPAVLEATLPGRLLLGRAESIMGHSMGGHGALVCALKCVGRFLSCSAFAPIAHPSVVPWGTKAFSAYLGPDAEASQWSAWDATELVKGYKGPDLHLRVDQGSKDSFLVGGVNQLQPDAFVAACKEASVPLEFHSREGYDHGFYFIATFVEDHIRHHAKYLTAAAAAASGAEKK